MQRLSSNHIYIYAVQEDTNHWVNVNRWSSNEYVMGNRYYCHSSHSNMKTSIAGTFEEHVCTILYEFVVQYRFNNLLDIYRDTNMSLWTHTAVVHFIWMWILMSVDHAKILFVSYFLYMLPSKHTHWCLNVTPPIKIQLCHSSLILQLFIQFETEYYLQWIIHISFSYRIV